MKSTPLKVRLAEGQQCAAGIDPPGEFTSIWVFIAIKGMLCVLTNAYEIKECEALESKRTLAGIELMLNVPIITSGAPTTVSGATWFTLLVLYAGFWLLFCL